LLQDLRATLRSKAIILILLSSATIRCLFFFFLSDSPSKFGPDEGTYAALTKYVSEGRPVIDFPVYGAVLYNSARSFILPSTLLVKIDINELDAVRMTSSIYGLSTILILSMTYLSLQQKFEWAGRKKESFFDIKSIMLIGAFASVPSNFIWSAIGLRESGSQFWIMTTFYFLSKVYFSSGFKLLSYFALSILSLMLAFGSRPEVALLFSIVTLFFSFLTLIKSHKLAPIAAVLIGLILGQTYSSAWDIPSSKNPNSISDQEVVIDQGAIARQDNVNSKEENNAVILFRKLTNNLGIIESIENKRNLNSIGAESALPQSSCVDQSQDLIRILKCNAVELPYRLFAFLFRPLIFFDEGSLLLKLASIENLGWLLILPYGLFIAFRRNTNSNRN
jgi:hypothetical protein